MDEYQYYAPLIFGAVAMIINTIAYIIVKKLSFPFHHRRRPFRLCCCAWTCIFAAFILIAMGGFTIYLCLSVDNTAETWIGLLIVLSGLYWLIQTRKYYQMARTRSAGYQPFNHNDSGSAPREEPQRRRSNAPLIVEVDSNNPNVSIEPDLSSSISAKCSSQTGKARYSQPLVRSAVPPSPFIGTQGTDSYVAIPMSITKTQLPRSGCTTPQGTSPTLGHLHDEEEEEEIEMNDTLTEPHAEASTYIEEEEEARDGDEEDGKSDEVEQTPMGGPERKTSEGNDTMC